MQVHSEHDWQEQSDAPIIVSRFPFRSDEYFAACGGSAAFGSENHTTAPSARWKCTPSAACGAVSPRESVSHDSQSPAAPYESCSLATPKGEILAMLTLEMLMSSKAGR